MTGEEAVVFERLAEGVRAPERATDGSAGYDIRAHLTGGPVRIYRRALDAVVEEPPVPAAAAESAGPGPDGGRPAILLEPGDRALVPTGFRARLPRGTEGQIRIRSSVAFRKGLIVPNAPGTVDADYPDEWFVLVQNASHRRQRIEHGERIAQVVLSRYRTLRWEEGTVATTTDRLGGLGSTGS